MEPTIMPNERVPEVIPGRHKCGSFFENRLTKIEYNTGMIFWYINGFCPACNTFTLIWTTFSFLMPSEGKDYIIDQNMLTDEYTMTDWNKKDIQDFNKIARLHTRRLEQRKKREEKALQQEKNNEGHH